MTLGCLPGAAAACKAHEPGTAIDTAAMPAPCRNFLLDKGCLLPETEDGVSRNCTRLAHGRLGALGSGRSYMCSNKLPWAAMWPTLQIGTGKISSTAIAHRSLT